MLWADYWDEVMLSKRAVRHRAFGSHIGATDSHFYIKNNLTVKDTDMRLHNRKRFYPIIRNGIWVVKKLDFTVGDTVYLRVNFAGDGTGYAYVSYNNGEGVEILAVKKVVVGSTMISFVVPESVLRDFKIGVGTTLPAGAKTTYLPRKEKYALKHNALLLSPSRPMHETQGLGDGGLGAVYNIKTHPTGGKVEGVPLWDGDLSTFSWATHKFQGQKVVDKKAGEGPVFETDLYRHSMCRTSFYSAVFDFEGDGSFMGWSNVDGLWGTEGVPAGLPLCLVTQSYYYRKRKKSGKNKYEFMRLRPKDGVAGSQKAFEKLCFYSGNTASAVTRQYSVSKGIIQASDETGAGGMIRPTNDTKWNPKSSSHFEGNGQSIYATTGYADDCYISGKTVPMTETGRPGKLSEDLALLVEWYNPHSKTWSEPRTQPHLSGMPTVNASGYSKVVFRFPRQLDTDDDKKIHEELLQNGIDYSFEKTKKAYRYVGYDSSAVATIYYRVIGRPNGPDGREVTFTDASGDTYKGINSSNVRLLVQYAQSRDSDSYAASTVLHGIGAQMTIVDSEKLAKINYPELYNVYFAAGEFNSGDTIFAIGKCMNKHSMSVITSLNKNDQWWDVIERHDVFDDSGRLRVREINDGSLIGTRDADIIRPAGVIDADQIEAGDLVNHADLGAVWKKVMGKPLTADYFRETSLKDPDLKNPLHYLQRDEQSGDVYSFPYQIIWYQIPMNYTGPYVDYEQEETTDKDGNPVIKYKIIAPENKPFAIKSAAKDTLYLNTSTIYRQYISQQIEITDEITQQRDLEAAGFDPADTLTINQMDFEAETVTKSEVQQQTEQQYLDMIGESGDDTPEPGAPKKIRKGPMYVKSWWDARFKFGKPVDYVHERELKDAGILGLGAFTDSKDFTVEDVTDKWGARGISSVQEGSYSTELMPTSNPDPEPDPMLGFGALGLIDSAEEDWADVERDAGYLLSAGANAGAELLKGMWNISTGEFGKAGDNIVDMSDHLLDANPKNDSVITISANMTRNAAQAAGKGTVDTVVDVGEDIVAWGTGLLGGHTTSMAGYSNLGEVDTSKADKIEGYGHNTGAFFKGLISRLIPDAFVEEFEQHPVRYTSIVVGVLTAKLWLGPLTSAVGSAMPKMARSVAATPGAVVGGAMDGAIQVASGIKGIFGATEESLTRRQVTRRKARRGSARTRRRRR